MHYKPIIQRRYFGAITCESCKAFFRRNALKDKIWKCPSDGKCQITATTKKLCKTCRLNKCFAVGMRKELILTDEEREERRQLVEENRHKRKQLRESQNTSSEANEPSNSQSLESTISSNCGDSDSLDDIIGCVSDDTDEDLSAQIMEIENYVNSEHSDHSIEALGDRPKLETRQIAIVPMFKGLTDYNTLNELEINKLGELLSLSKIFEYPSSKHLLKLKDITQYLKITPKRAEETVRELLSFSKGLSGFTNDKDTSVIASLDLFNDEMSRYLLLKCRSDCESQERLCKLMNTFANIYEIRRNFFVFTCDSCKYFFRRYALNDKPFKCPTSGKCVINPQTRSLCKKCRLHKCFEVGMRKELIRSDAENQLRKLEVRENKRKLNLLNEYKNSVDSEYSDYSTSSLLPRSYENDDRDFILDLIENTLNISDERIKEIESYLSLTTSNTYLSLDEILAKYEKFFIIPVFRELVDYNGLNELESNRISELLNASKIINYPMTKNNFMITDWDELVKVTSYRTEVQIQEFITFCKTFNGLSNLCSADQSILIKYGLMELFVIYHLLCYNKDTQKFTIYLDDDNSVIVGYEYFEYKDIDYLHIMRDLLDKLLPEIKRDFVIKNLIIWIIIAISDHA
ncbi:unnamed protein product [Oppiella nova]|uniref:Nuclear receptor n=1 Tax=Oppiella nova TaxID=334625 RepID=A0A7R9LCE6_9ACAR|nr:unnamed protein product [Oppiella nova]CAG2162121.1 unnamed protein product [Oppiella nova]